MIWLVQKVETNILKENLPSLSGKSLNHLPGYTIHFFKKIILVLLQFKDKPPHPAL